MSDATIVLYRPVGPRELELLRASDWRRWPPRLPDQPIFYPVTNERYAAEIAEQWNVAESGAGYVTRFHVRRTFMDRYDIQCVGAAHHTEWWIPAEELSELNANIVGRIEVVRAFGSATDTPIVDSANEVRAIAGPLHVAFRGPAHGWLAITMSDGGTRFELTVSYTPNDFLRELVLALRGAADTNGSHVALAYTEPEIYAFTFTRSEAKLELVVSDRASRAIVFAFAGAPLDIVLPFWRALRRLQTEFDVAQWRQAFPEDEVARLGDAVASMKAAR